VGMPASLDLQGQGLGEAFRLVEELGEGGRGWLFGGNRKLSDIPRKLTEVDLLAELETPEEIKAISRMSWLQTGEADYFLGCGSDDQERRCEAKITCDTLGIYRLVLSSDKRRMEVDLGSERSAAFNTADAAVRLEFPGAAAIASHAARWRDDKPSDKQIALLRRKGVDEYQISKMNKGQASQMLDKIFAKGRS
jgi:hypothetical protein